MKRMSSLRRFTSVLPVAWVGLFAAATAGAQTSVFCNMTINVPGQYIFTSDLACAAAPGLEVVANNVRIDFNGHSLAGPGVGVGIITAQAGACVGVVGLRLNGGTITGFDTGIELCAPVSTAMNAHVNAMTVTENFSVGIDLQNSDGNRINGNTIAANSGITSRSFAVRLLNSHNNRFNGNQVYDNENGTGVQAPCGAFGLFESNNNLVASNDISNNGINNLCGVGVVLVRSSANTVRGNIVNNNRHGIFVISGSNHTIQSNTANQNRGLGIFVENSNNNLIQDNTAFNNGSFDLDDTDSSCDNNTWKSNTFGTSNQSCIK